MIYRNTNPQQVFKSYKFYMIRISQCDNSISLVFIALNGDDLNGNLLRSPGLKFESNLSLL